MVSSSIASLPDGWAMCRIVLRADGTDLFGWKWGHGDPLWYLTDGVDSLTIRAPSPVAALAVVTIEGWPPKTVRRYNWEYAV